MAGNSDSSKSGHSASSRAWSRSNAAWLGLVLVLLLGALFRFSGLNWDDNQHLQPDGRRFDQIATTIEWPGSISAYFDSANSSLNPYNQTFGDYVDGDFPLFLNKAVADIAGKDNFAQITGVSRSLSSLFDLLTILLIFLAARRLFNDSTALAAATLYAVTVLPIQLAHFGTFDAFVTAMVTAAFVCALWANDGGRWWQYTLIGVCAALAIGSNLQMLPVLALTALPLAEQVRTRGWRRFASRRDDGLMPPLLGTAAGLVVALWTFRTVQPYAFLGPSPIHFRLDPRWSDAIHTWRERSAGFTDEPTYIQWAGHSFGFVLQNTLFWGLGVALGLTAFAALALAGVRLVIARRWPPAWQVVLVGLPAAIVVYNGITFVKSTERLLPAYPFLAMLAAAFLVGLWQRGRTATRPLARLLAPVPLVAVVALTALYAIAFSGIYHRPNTRVEASVWIYDNIPSGASLLTENWDEQLPLSIPGYEAIPYTTDRIDLFGIDDANKLNTMVEQLDRADYIVLASNAVSDSIPRIPEKYPMTSAYYDMLFSGDLGFERLQTFTSAPEILGITLDDSAADQPFTNSDHPSVIIFRKTDGFDADTVSTKLGAVLDSHDVVNLNPLQTGHDMLMFDDAERVAQQTGGTWSAMFTRGDWANRHPAVIWYLTLQLMALVALPLCWRVLSGLPDRGYAVAKTIGLLSCAYIGWLLPSLKLMDFGRSTVVIGIVATAVVSVLLVARHARSFWSDLVSRQADILATELIFLAAFALWVWLRAHNPDLWHPYRGGEKPMEFAYFNAIIRSTHFPPIDPWFAGGYINYYYLGYAIMAGVTRFTGVVPWVAFNLAVPTLFALLVLNTWSFVRNMLGLFAVSFGKRSSWALPLTALLGPLFVVGLGNLDLARRVGRGEYGFGNAGGESTLGIRTLGQIVHGVLRTYWRHQPVPTDTFWAPSRVIPDTVNEFPNFTFLFADFHPHMVGLTFTSGVLVVALAVFQSHRWPAATNNVPIDDGRRLFASTGLMRSALGSIPRGITKERLLLVGLTGFVTGALYPLNTWDFPTYIAIVCGAFALLELIAVGTSTQSPSRSHWELTFAALRRVAIWSVATIVLGRILFYPYFAHYAQPNSGFIAFDGIKTRTSQYALINGIMLFFIVSFLLAQCWILLKRRRFGTARIDGFRVVDLPDAPDTRLVALTIRRSTIAVNPAIPVTAAVTVLTMIGLLDDRLFWFLGALLLLDLVVAFCRRYEPLHLFLCGLVAISLTISTVIERYTLRGDIGRFNTVFKFYLQIWMMLSLVAAVGTVLLITRYRRLMPLPGRIIWSAIAVVLLLAGFVYPVLATPGRLDDRFVSLPPTLNGMAFMTQATYDDALPDNSEVRPYPLIDDYEAINWLLDNVEGSPVILEGITPLYRWGSRISVYTGLPTVLGWDWHQTQQRAGYDLMIQQRGRDVSTMFDEDVDFSVISPLLDKYHVRYIYVGPLERIYYSEEGLAKFDRAVDAGQLSVAYQTDKVTIYEYDPPKS